MTAVRLNQGLRDRIDSAADTLGVSRTDLMSDACEAYLAAVGTATRNLQGNHGADCNPPVARRENGGSSHAQQYHPHPHSVR